MKLPQDLLELRDQPEDEMRDVLKPMAETALFFHAIAPVLVANVLTVAFVYASVKINQKEWSGVERKSDAAPICG